jgi:hypothetical protein
VSPDFVKSWEMFGQVEYICQALTSINWVSCIQTIKYNLNILNIWNFFKDVVLKTRIDWVDSYLMFWLMKFW